MASPTISEILRSDLHKLHAPSSASITNIQQLSSYNWIEAPSGKPTIAIPGCPSLWTSPIGSKRLPKDHGRVYIAQNAYRHSQSPLEPLFRALYFSNPSYDIRQIDIVTDRNNIRKLLSYVKGGVRLEAFTFKVEMVEKTAIFCREETRTYEDIGPHDFRGYGHEFEKAYTKNEIEESTGHHRVISYRFGNLNIIVRHETDGIFESLSVSPSKSVTTMPAGSVLHIKNEGHLVPLESTLEIKTRVFHKPLNFNDIAPQLWVSQTPQLVRAYHNKGTFSEARVENVATHVKKWEEDNQKDLVKMAALFEKVVSLVRESGGIAMVRYDVIRNSLVVQMCGDETKMLPEDLYSKWKDDKKSKDSGTEGTET
ncbi:hypothetical protein HYALB_00001364 [Hymenoscyphus albidus]|uniref:Geranylgeranyl pyrophosphate synthetase n=1 Tax=Hymenoscyphus albidus TaxID=595503 RepID=A0A9N9Q2P0_9HELO|nr:hypothetical protein HYALB_00001364 [Hymenoscyphus albidus]